MTGPSVRVITGHPSYPDRVELGAAPTDTHELRGVRLQAVVHDDATMQAVLDAALRGGDLVIAIELDVDRRSALLDQLRRIATVEMEPVGLASDEAVLLDNLRHGASLHEAASAASMSRRTAARRLSQLRTRFGVASTAELLIRVSET